MDESAHHELANWVKAHGSIFRLEPRHGYSFDLAADAMGALEEGYFLLRVGSQAAVKTGDPATNDGQVIFR